MRGPVWCGVEATTAAAALWGHRDMGSPGRKPAGASGREHVSQCCPQCHENPDTIPCPPETLPGTLPKHQVLRSAGIEETHSFLTLALLSQGCPGLPREDPASGAKSLGPERGHHPAKPLTCVPSAGAKAQSSVAGSPRPQPMPTLPEWAHPQGGPGPRDPNRALLPSTLEQARCGHRTHCSPCMAAWSLP